MKIPTGRLLATDNGYNFFHQERLPKDTWCPIPNQYSLKPQPSTKTLQGRIPPTQHKGVLMNILPSCYIILLMELPIQT